MKMVKTNAKNLMMFLATMVFISWSVHAAEIPHIFVVNSHAMESNNGNCEEMEGFYRRMKKLGYERDRQYCLSYSTLESLSFTDAAVLGKKSAEILACTEKEKPDLVLTIDDDALELVGMHVSGIPVVFSGINKPMREYMVPGKIQGLQKPGFNLTGVYQKPYFQETIAYLKRIVPSIKNMGVISCRGDQGELNLQKLTLLNGKLGVEWVESMVSDSWNDWRQAVLDWQKKVDMILFLSADGVTDEKGKSVSEKEIFKWVAENSHLPDAGLWKSMVEYGVLLTSSDCACRQGEMAADRVVQILGGCKSGDISVDAPREGVLTINIDRVKMLNLKMPLDILPLARIVPEISQ